MVMRQKPEVEIGRMVLINGASQSGKTTYAMHRFKNPRCAFVFDIDDQWSRKAGYKRIAKISELHRLVVSGVAGRYAFVPPCHDVQLEFEAFCRCVWHYAEYFGECVCIVEELAELGGAGKATGTWGSILRRGLKRGITIGALLQSWSEGDKTAMKNASEFVMFRMVTMGDIKYMHERTRVPLQDLTGLKPYEFVHYDTTTFTVTSGTVSKTKINFSPKT